MTRRRLKSWRGRANCSKTSSAEGGRTETRTAANRERSDAVSGSCQETAPALFRGPGRSFAVPYGDVGVACVHPYAASENLLSGVRCKLRRSAIARQPDDAPVGDEDGPEAETGRCNARGCGAWSGPEIASQPLADSDRRWLAAANVERSRQHTFQRFEQDVAAVYLRRHEPVADIRPAGRDLSRGLCAALPGWNFAQTKLEFQTQPVAG